MGDADVEKAFLDWWDGEISEIQHEPHEKIRQEAIAELESSLAKVKEELELSRKATLAALNKDDAAKVLMARIEELKSELAKLREQFEETKNQLHLANIDAVKNEAEANELREQNQALRELLKKAHPFLEGQDDGFPTIYEIVGEALKRGEAIIHFAEDKQETGGLQSACGEGFNGMRFESEWEKVTCIDCLKK